MIARLDVVDLLVGAATAAAATWTSLHLLPPGTGRLRPAALARLGLRFVRQSADRRGGCRAPRARSEPAVAAGFRALSRCAVAPGPARNAFCTLASLLPGTLPAGSEPDGALRVHCLDLGQDVQAQMSAEEAMFLAALGRAAGDG